MPPSIDAPAWHDQVDGDTVAQVLAELASHPDACPLVADLAARLALDVDVAWDALRDAETAGWAECWPDDPRGPSVVLSARSAARLGLVLAGDGSRWLARGETDLTTIDRRLRALVETDCRDRDGADLFDLLADIQSREGLDSLLLMERAATLAAEYQATPQPDPNERVGRAWRGFNDERDHAKLPSLQLILGLAPIWPVRYSAHGPCPGCGSRPMALTTVCLRSGLDHLLPETKPLPPGPGPEERAKTAHGRKSSRRGSRSRRS